MIIILTNDVDGDDRVEDISQLIFLLFTSYFSLSLIFLPLFCFFCFLLIS